MSSAVGLAPAVQVACDVVGSLVATLPAITVVFLAVCVAALLVPLLVDFCCPYDTLDIITPGPLADLQELGKIEKEAANAEVIQGQASLIKAEPAYVSPKSKRSRVTSAEPSKQAVAEAITRGALT